jgi:pimeloyl-ACP methyl ester carboxylesterase
MKLPSGFVLPWQNLKLTRVLPWQNLKLTAPRRAQPSAAKNARVSPWLALQFGVALLFCGQSSALTLGNVRFSSCEIGKGLSLTKAECARVPVPENYAEPAGKKLMLHVALIASGARNPPPDPVLFLAGGPGQASSDGFGQMAAGFREILKTRHLLLIDQRGTGLSHALNCELPEEVLNGQTEPDANTFRALTKACLAKQDVNPAFFTTTVATKDLETLRLALAAPQLNLVGFSYGTRVAQQFAMHYPKSTRSLILDGVAPNTQILGSEHARNLDVALAQQFARCVADRECHAAFGNPAETLAAVRTDLLANPRAVAMNDPLTGKMRSVSLNVGALQGMARFYVYGSEMSALVPLLLNEAKLGRPQPMLAQSEMATKTIGDQMAQGMQLSVICSEDAAFLKPNPEDDKRLLGGDFVTMLLAQCQEWPKGERPADFFQALKSDIPTLIISGEYDPVTPARYGAEVLKSLSNAIHIVAPAQGHVNLARGCIPKLGGQFIESLKPKEIDTKCVAEIKPAPFFLEFTGPSP